MKRRILLGVLLAAGTSFSVQAKEDNNATVSAAPVRANLANRAAREEAASRLMGLLSSSKWLDKRTQERLFDVIADDKTREDLQHQIAALREQKEELDRLLVAKMGELDSLKAGSITHAIKQGEINEVKHQIDLTEKKIASLINNRGIVSRETLMAAVLPLVYLAWKCVGRGQLPTVGQLVKATIAFALIEWFLRGRNSLVFGQVASGGRDLLGFIGDALRKVFGQGELLDSAVEWVEQTLRPVTSTISDTFSGSTTDAVLAVAVVATLVYGVHQYRKA